MRVLSVYRVDVVSLTGVGGSNPLALFNRAIYHHSR